MAELIPISSLENLSDAKSKQIRGVITLVWPYSSSSRKAAFLVADPDFRQRKNKGQVRIQVQGHAAIAIAKSRLGIGDEVVFSLNGAQWVEPAQGEVSTPGKSVDLELLYKNVLKLQICRNGQQTDLLEINENSSPPASPPIPAFNVHAQTPLSSVPARLSMTTYATPAKPYTPLFHKYTRKVSGEAVDSPLDPFTDPSDGDQARPRKRPRTSWGTPVRWTLDKQAPSPEKSKISRIGLNFWTNDDRDLLSPEPEPTPAVKNATSAEPQPQTEPEAVEKEHADSVATSPIGEDEMTQIVEEAKADFGRRREEIESQRQALLSQAPDFNDVPSFGDQPGEIPSTAEPSAEFEPLASPPPDPGPSNYTGERSRAPRALRASNAVTLAQGALGSAIGTGSTVQPQTENRTEAAADGDDAVILNTSDVLPTTSQLPQISVTAEDRFPAVVEDAQEPQSATAMAPPTRSSRPITPQLQPVQSTGLPLPSPFPHDDLTDPMERAERQLEQAAGKSTPSPVKSPVKSPFSQPRRPPLFSDSSFGFGFGSFGRPTAAPGMAVDDDAGVSKMRTSWGSIPNSPDKVTAPESTTQATTSVSTPRVEIPETAQSDIVGSLSSKSPEIIELSDDSEEFDDEGEGSDDDEIEEYSGPSVEESEEYESEGYPPAASQPKGHLVIDLTELSDSNDQSSESELDEQHEESEESGELEEDEEESDEEEQSPPKVQEQAKGSWANAYVISSDGPEDETSPQPQPTQLNTHSRDVPYAQPTQSQGMGHPSFANLNEAEDRALRIAYSQALQVGLEEFRNEPVDEADRTEPSSFQNAQSFALSEDASMEFLESQPDVHLHHVDASGLQLPHQPTASLPLKAPEVEQSQLQPPNLPNLGDSAHFPLDPEILNSSPLDFTPKKLPSDISRSRSDSISQPLSLYSTVMGQSQSQHRRQDENEQQVETAVAFSRQTTSVTVTGLNKESQQSPPSRPNAIHRRFPSSPKIRPSVEQRSPNPFFTAEPANDEVSMLDTGEIIWGSQKPRPIPGVSQSPVHLSLEPDEERRLRVSQERYTSPNRPLYSPGASPLKSQIDVRQEKSQEKSRSASPRQNEAFAADRKQAETQESTSEPEPRTRRMSKRRNSVADDTPAKGKRYNLRHTASPKPEELQEYFTPEPSQSRKRYNLRSTSSPRPEEQKDESTADASQPRKRYNLRHTTTPEPDESDAEVADSAPGKKRYNLRRTATPEPVQSTEIDRAAAATGKRRYNLRRSASPEAGPKLKPSPTPRKQYNLRNTTTPEPSKRKTRQLTPGTEKRYNLRSTATPEPQPTEKEESEVEAETTGHHYSLRSVGGTPKHGRASTKSETPAVSQAGATQATFVSTQDFAGSRSPEDMSVLLTPSRPPVAGLRTSFSYYAPLANLPTYMNATWPHESLVDVITVVYRASSDPLKAEKGQRDFFTKLRVTQPGFYPSTTLVQCFRPHKRALPVAQAGDVLLLTGFEVTALKGGGAGLKSGEQSAWCVFKKDGGDKAKRSRKPKWAKKEGDDEGEVMAGPPAEFGDEEREEAERLKTWWTERSKA